MKKAILSLTSLILLAFTISLPLRADSVLYDGRNRKLQR